MEWKWSLQTVLSFLSCLQIALTVVRRRATLRLTTLNVICLDVSVWYMVNLLVDLCSNLSRSVRSRWRWLQTRCQTPRSDSQAQIWSKKGHIIFFMILLSFPTELFNGAFCWKRLITTIQVNGHTIENWRLKSQECLHLLRLSGHWGRERELFPLFCDSLFKMCLQKLSYQAILWLLNPVLNDHIIQLSFETGGILKQVGSNTERSIWSVACYLRPVLRNHLCEMFHLQWPLQTVSTVLFVYFPSDILEHVVLMEAQLVFIGQADSSLIHTLVAKTCA